MVLRTLIALFVVLLSARRAEAQRDITRDALEILSGMLETRIEDGRLNRTDVTPALVASTRVRYEASQGWFTTEAISTLARAFGPKGLRVCEACMVPRTFAARGYLEQNAGPLSIDDIVRLDASARASAEPAKTAIWLDETKSGVAVKVVNLRTAHVIWAENIDPNLTENAETERALQLSREYERRARGDSIAQVFFDVSVFPQQHVSLDFTDQWGETNANFAGLTLSFFDPVLGIGATYARAFDFGQVAGFRFAPQLGVKAVVSLPILITDTVNPEEDNSDDVIPGDNLLNLIGILRIPFGRSNYGIELTVATSGRVGIGLSLININFFPVVL